METTLDFSVLIARLLNAMSAATMYWSRFTRRTAMSFVLSVLNDKASALKTMGAQSDMFLLRLVARLWFGHWGENDPRLPRYTPFHELKKKKKKNRP